jgi:hypothetical protein
MKAVRVCALILASAAGACAAERREPDVLLVVHGNEESLGTLSVAEGIASRMLASAGIIVAWRIGSRNDHRSAEVIEVVLTQERDETVKPGVLAFSVLGIDARKRIEVFCNRVRGIAFAANTSPVLAHVLVHEITHVLQGVNRHSETGVMKAHWNIEERRQMTFKALAFDPEDIRLLHEWCERHNRIHVSNVR